MVQSLQFSQPLYQQIYDIIKRSILAGELKPGEKVNVSQLAEKYNISRTPLREALRQLQIEGLLVQDHLGLSVVKLEESDFNDLYECRLMLEPTITRLILKTITDKELEEIKIILLDAERAFEEGNHLQLLELNAQFHDRLLEASPNKRALHLLQQVRSFLLLYRANILKNNEHNREILKEHRQILNALIARDEESVIQNVKVHLRNDLERGTNMIRE
ncbi:MULTISPECIES: GntR family transcriptional regulator [unclassified Cytobacillus]|uniref:GntR family transcriptional regulator n=1 Tax=unclassified Cytobacillus TaxID=2675268 RepID=UPI00203D9FE0|nr:GntR family transcriptional regulator [Cytobacillus sp. AMY 15.2]MCM3089894.1 GntR family transcriptional regulator [Cytobacillus sp. AMY 15.2]